MKKRKYLRKNSGITLLALVITIIVLLILVGIVLNYVVGDNSIIGNGFKSKDETRYARIVEERDLWNYEKGIAKHTDGTGARSLSEVADELYKKGTITEEEKNKIINGESIVVAGKTISFGLDNEKLYVRMSVDDTNDRYALVTLQSIIGGVEECLSYEDFTNIRDYLKDKTDEEKINMYLEKRKNFFNIHYPDQELSMELVYNYYGVENLEELFEYNGVKNLDELLIDAKAYNSTDYSSYTTAYRKSENYKTVTITKHDGTTVTGNNVTSTIFPILENGSYNIKIQYNDDIVEKNIQISNIKPVKEYELTKIGDNLYAISCIEDLVKLSENINMRK